MDVVVKDKVVKRIIEIGDVVVFKDGENPYLIIRESSKYIAKCFDGDFGAVGSHDSLSELVEAMNKHGFEHYSKYDYKIEIVKI